MYTRVLNKLSRLNFHNTCEVHADHLDFEDLYRTVMLNSDHLILSVFLYSPYKVMAMELLDYGIELLEAGNEKEKIYFELAKILKQPNKSAL